MNTKAAVCQSAGKANWELASFHRQMGQTDRSRYHALLAQVYYTEQRLAESEVETVQRQKRGLLARLLS